MRTPPECRVLGLFCPHGTSRRRCRASSEGLVPTHDADGDGGKVGMGYGDEEVFLADADRLSEPHYLAGDADEGSPAGTPDHLDAIPLDQTAPQSFCYGLLGGPATGVVALSEAELLAVGDLVLGEEALAYPGGAFEGELHPIDVHDVYPDRKSVV